MKYPGCYENYNTLQEELLVFFLLKNFYQEPRKVLTMLGYLNQPLPDPPRQTHTALVTAKSTGWVVI